MRAPLLHVLAAAAVLAVGVALAPAAAAASLEQTHAALVLSSADPDPAVASLTAREAALDAAAQHADDTGSMTLVRSSSPPRAWLLLLLAPILLGGAVGVGLTLRRLR